MPLIKRCSTTAMSQNVRREIHRRCRGKRGRRKWNCHEQAVAIGYSVLKRACGVKTERKLTPKQIVARRRKR